MAGVRVAARPEHAVVARRGPPESARLRKRPERVLPDGHRYPNDAGAPQAAARCVGMAVPHQGVRPTARAEFPAARVPLSASRDDGFLIMLRWPFARRRPPAFETLEPQAAYA